MIPQNTFWTPRIGNGVPIFAQNTEWLRSVDRPFRMWDKDWGVCQFIRHATCDVQYARVRFPDGSERTRHIGQEVEWYPCGWLDLRFSL